MVASLVSNLCLIGNLEMGSQRTGAPVRDAGCACESVLALGSSTGSLRHKCPVVKRPIRRTRADGPCEDPLAALAAVTRRVALGQLFKERGHCPPAGARRNQLCI